MSSNIIGPLHKKSYAPSEKIEKASGNFDDIKETMVTNIDTVDKEDKSRKTWLRKPKNLLYQKK